jgi:hypothetical protein
MHESQGLQDRSRSAVKRGSRGLPIMRRACSSRDLVIFLVGLWCISHPRANAVVRTVMVVSCASLFIKRRFYGHPPSLIIRSQS